MCMFESVLLRDNKTWLIFFTSNDDLSFKQGINNNKTKIKTQSASDMGQNVILHLVIGVPIANVPLLIANASANARSCVY